MVNSIINSRYLPQDVLKSIDRWVTQITNNRDRSKGLKARRARRSLRLPYRVIGSGLTRIVYDLDNGYVVKIAISKRGLMSNEREYDVYSHCSRRLRRYLCPILELG